MATIVLTTAIGAVLNAASFIGGSYLAKFLTGKEQDKERKRHDLALEKYEKDYNDWKEKMGRVQLWQEQREKNKDEASYNFQSTDEALRVYAKTHPDDVGDSEEPNFNDYYSPSKDQKNGEMLFTGLTVAGLTYGISKIY